MSPRRRSLLAVLLLLLAPPLPSQDPAASRPASRPSRPEAALALEAALKARLGRPLDELDIDLVMMGEDFFGARPRDVRWSPDGDALFFDWKRWDEERRGTFRYDLEEGTLRRLDEDERPPARGPADRRRGFRVFVRDQSLFHEPLGRGAAPRLLLRWTERPRGTVIAADGSAAFFATSGGVFRVPLPEGGLVQLLELTDRPPPKEEEEPEGLARYHRDREAALSRRLHEKARDRERARERRERRRRRRTIPVYHVPEGFEVSTTTVSPSGLHAAILLTKGAKARRTAVPDYVTPEGYTASRSARPKVGDEPGERRLRVVDLVTGEATAPDEPLPGVAVVPRAPVWSPDGRHLLFTAATDDDENAWLVAVDAPRGNVGILHHLHDPAWTLHAGFRPRFLGESSRAVFRSEASGWAHLWLADVETREVRPLTSGRFEVSDPQPAPDGDVIYAVATPTSPHVRDLVSVDAATGDTTILTADGGGRSITLSPDGTHVAEVFSRGDRPWELRVRPLTEGHEPVVVTRSPSPAFESYGRWEDPEIVHVPASDGVRVPARIYRPRDPHPGRPAVIFVHGAGYLQNVHHWWSSYYREYGFHHLLRDEGYLVLDLDYRGSAGYGRDWRTAIREHMGGRDLQDHLDAARWLVAEEGVSPDRIGIYGGSYGGFLTLMALFRSPGTFRAGAALRPVTDWSHYNDWYTSRILDDPLENPEAYHRSSPINFAEHLEDHLLICHGILDDNVHAQGVFRLQQRLIELRKRDWEVAYYPLEGHSFTDAASWSDEYRRIKALFDRVLLE